ncbi:MAG: F0F1 ATP synthase subunit B [Bacteroidaceae bacterium]|nr:F0F1 ATP synthase subunit B [Bacteroidaceae bacterium]
MSFLLPDAGLLFWMLVVFGIVFFILAKFGFPAIVGMVDERKRLIDESVRNAQEANERLKAVNAESEELLKAAREEQAKILREAAAMRNDLLNEARKKAEADGEKIIAEARHIIQQEKEDALRDVRRQVATLSVEIAEKILRRELSDKESQNAVIENLIDNSLKEKQQG